MHNQAEVSKVNYSSKAKSSNVRDLLVAKCTVLYCSSTFCTTCARRREDWRRGPGVHTIILHMLNLVDLPIYKSKLTVSYSIL